MKKSIILSLLIVALCTCLLAGCLVTAASPDDTSPTDPLTTSVAGDSTTSSDYDKVLALRTESYQTLSLKDFNAAVKTAIDNDADFLSMYCKLLDDLTSDDNEYQFVYVTLSHSISEVIMSQMGEPISVSDRLNKNEGAYSGNDGNIFYDFMFTALYSVEYRVLDDNELTVKERDELISAYHTGLQNAVNDMNKEQLTESGIKPKLRKIADGLCSDLSSDILVFENAEIHSVEILDGSKEYLQ